MGRSRDITELVEAFYQRLWNRWDDSLVDQVLAEGFTFRGSLGQEMIGRQAWRDYRNMIRAGAPDFHNQIVALITDGDRAAARLRYSGTHLGDMLGLPASGCCFAYDGVALFAAAGGELTDAWVLGDVDSLRRQLSTQPCDARTVR